MKIPGWLMNQMRESDLGRIREAILQTESRTSAEVVPMIVRESTRTGHVFWLVFFGSLALVWGAMPYLVALDADVVLSYWIWEIGSVALSMITATLLARIEFVRRLLTPWRDRRSGAMMRAQLEFYELGLTETTGRSGVLVFVSLFERQAVVLADRSIASRLPPETWDSVVRRLIERVKERDFAGGVCAALTACGDVLAPHFPRLPEDRDELPNRLVIEE